MLVLYCKLVINFEGWTWNAIQPVFNKGWGASVPECSSGMGGHQLSLLYIESRPALINNAVSL